MFLRDFGCWFNADGRCKKWNVIKAFVSGLRYLTILALGEDCSFIRLLA